MISIDRLFLTTHCDVCINVKNRIIKDKYEKICYLFRCLTDNNEWNNEQIYLKLPQFTYITHGPFVSVQECIRKFKETRHSRYIYQMS